MSMHVPSAGCASHTDSASKAALLFLAALLLVFSWTLVAAEASAQNAGTYRTIEWVDLLPDDDLDALLNPPEMLAGIEDGSPEDQLTADGGLPGGYGDSDVARRFEAALQSTAVRAEFDGTRVRIPGFVVPLAFDETRMISEFFLVPYFGACLHLPPPPPNQIIHSTFTGGLSLNDTYEPYWLEGTLSVELEENELGISAYSINVDRISRYDGE